MRNSSWIARGATVALASLTIAATPRPFTSGWSFTWKITADEMPSNAASKQPSMGIQMIPGKIRMDFVGEPSQGMKKGGYMLFDAEAGTMAMVSPEDKAAMVFEGAGLGAMAGAVGSVVKMDVSDLKVNVEDLGAGERLLGRATQKFRITRGYSMQVSVFGKKSKTTHESVTEAWISKEMLVDKSWEAWSDRFARGSTRLGGDAMQKLIEAEKQVPKGVPLKQTTATTDTDDKGNVTKSKMTMELTSLKQEDISPTVFEIPKDYTVTDTKQTLAQTEKAMQQAKDDCEKEHGKGSKECDLSQVNLDSLVTAARTGAMEGLKEGIREAAKESAKDAVKRGILGKLKKPGGDE